MVEGGRVWIEGDVGCSDVKVTWEGYVCLSWVYWKAQGVILGVYQGVWKEPCVAALFEELD